MHQGSYSLPQAAMPALLIFFVKLIAGRKQNPDCWDGLFLGLLAT